MSGPAPIDRDVVVADLSRLARREIDPARSLNLHYGLDGDEIWSVLTRLCEHHAIDPELFWSKIDYDRYFLSEFDPIKFIWGWLRYLFGPRVEAQDPQPFMIDDLLRIMVECRTEPERRRS